MLINADLSERALVNSDALPWVASPLPGVERRMLERDGDEVARATTIVRYAAGSSFHAHTHEAGEEFFVLDGVFSDESGDYPEGTYVRNPPGSQHRPHSKDGCIIFVKLRQFDPDDREFVRINTANTDWSPGLMDGLRVMPLFERGPEHVALVRFAPGTQFQFHSHPGGEEILVLDGVFEDEHGRYPKGTWLRCPPGSTHQPFSNDGCEILVKTGHLG